MSDRTIRDAINMITNNHMVARVYIIEALVVSVNTSARTCVCEMVSGNSATILNDVRLMASVEDGFLIIPSIDSNVCIVMSDFTEPYISQYSGIDKIIFRGGDLGGLTKTLTLLTKLNNIEKLMNDLIIKFNTHTHNVTAVGAPTGPNILPQTQIMVLTQQAEIENKLVTHG